MAWPTVTIDTTAMDQDTDSPLLARAAIKQMADNVNAIKDARGAADGVASLDISGKVPAGQIPALGVDKGGTGKTSVTANAVLIGAGAAAMVEVAAGGAGTVLTSNGPSTAPSYQPASGFPTGTRMIFQQTSAPTGWTKEIGAAYNDIALRVVTGVVASGGTAVFSSVFAASKSTDAFTLTTSHIPAHAHNYSAVIPGAGSNINPTGGALVNGTGATTSTGGGSAHSHTISNFNLKYNDCIIATKD